VTTIFLRLMEAPVEDKPAALLETVAALHDPGNSQQGLQHLVFERDPAAFRGVPGSPFAYWVTDRVRKLFQSCMQFEADGRTVKQGLATADDFRFLRAWWEVQQGDHWFSFAKGGAFSQFYADIYLCVNWGVSGLEIKNNLNAQGTVRSNVWMLRDTAANCFGRCGLTWPRRTQSGLGMRVMPSGSIFADKGPAAFVHDNEPSALLALLALTTSSAFCYLVELQMAFGSYEVGVIQRTPVPKLSPDAQNELAQLARRAWSVKRQLDTTNETSHAFLLPASLNESVAGLNPIIIERELAEIKVAIDERVFELYGIGSEDRKAILRTSLASTIDLASEDAEEGIDDTDADEPAVAADRTCSWLVGIVFGRFDLRLATGERSIAPEPEPFDPLPMRSSGMWPEGDEALLVAPSIVVDDMGHREDFATLVSEASARVGLPDRQNMRSWLARDFFPLHIKMYSKSRRKAPIYWQLATPSASYSVWLYFHALNRDTLFRVQNDFATPKLLHEERKLELLRHEHGPSAGVSERRAIADQEALVEELRGFLDEVRRVAPLWNPNVDDGVLLNFAPLWRLVPQHRTWQRDLKAAWDALCNEQYDWAHLAMRLWPERVVPKCANDCSLAIAHGLEDSFWVQDMDGKWTARNTPTRPVEELVRERSSAAVKAALSS